MRDYQASRDHRTLTVVGSKTIPLPVESARLSERKYLSVRRTDRDALLHRIRSVILRHEERKDDRILH